MGSVVTVHVLNDLMNYHGADLKGKVETQFWGTCGLATVFADCANTGKVLHVPPNRVFIMAALNGHMETCNILLKHGANINGENNQGRTALHMVVACGHEGMCAFLLDYGAVIDGKIKFS